MSVDAVVLGLLSAIRTTPLAVVYGLLLTRRPSRGLAAYTAAGTTVSLGVGVAVVMLLDPIAGTSETTTTRQVVDVILGVGALSYAAGYAAGRIDHRSDRRSRAVSGRLGNWLRDPSPWAAAGAGAFTNLPGLFYLAALAAILETQPSPANAVIQVVVYNVLRFAVPLAALVAVVADVERTRRYTDTVSGWVGRHSRLLVPAVFGAVGVWLTTEGLTGLLA